MGKDCKKLKEFIGFYDIKILDISILLAVVDDHNSFLKLINNKKNKEYSDFISNNIGNFNISDGSGVVYRETNNKPLIVYIDSFYYKDNALEDILTHETNHLIERLSKYADFENESEFKAYLQTYIKKEFKNIIKSKNKK